MLHIISQILEQTLYTVRNTYAQYNLSPPINLECICVTEAADSRFQTLAIHGRPAFPEDVGLGQKITVRFQVILSRIETYKMLTLNPEQFHGHKPYIHQSNLLSAKSNRPTLGRLAHVIAKEFQLHLVSATLDYTFFSLKHLLTTSIFFLLTFHHRKTRRRQGDRYSSWAESCSSKSVCS